MKYEENVLTFLRKTDKPEETILAVFNFAGIPYEKYQVGVPFHGKYKEIFNTDRKEYGGEGMTNPRVKTSRAEECDERENSIKITVPALGAAIFSLHAGREEGKEDRGEKDSSEKNCGEENSCKERNSSDQGNSCEESGSGKEETGCEDSGSGKKGTGCEKSSSGKEGTDCEEGSSGKESNSCEE